VQNVSPCRLFIVVSRFNEHCAVRIGHLAVRIIIVRIRAILIFRWLFSSVWREAWIYAAVLAFYWLYCAGAEIHYAASGVLVMTAQVPNHLRVVGPSRRSCGNRESWI